MDLNVTVSCFFFCLLCMGGCLQRQGSTGIIKHSWATRVGFGDKSALGWQHGARQFVVFWPNGTPHCGVAAATRVGPGGQWILNMDAFQGLAVDRRPSLVIGTVTEPVSDRGIFLRSTPLIRIHKS